MNTFKNFIHMKSGNLFTRIFSFVRVCNGFIFHQLLFNLISLLIIPIICKTQDTTVISPKVGKIIDSTEKIRFGILPYYANAIFISAVFIEKMDSTFTLKAHLLPDSISERAISQNEINGIRQQINEGYIDYQFEIEHSDQNAIEAWIKIGGGFSTIGIAPGASISISSNKNLLTLRYLGSQELGSLGFFGHDDHPSKSFSEFGLLYGRIIGKNKNHAYTISTGISLDQGVKRGKFLYSNSYFFGEDKYFEKIKYTKLGLPIEFQYMPLNHLDFAISIFGNFMEAEIWGVLVSLCF